MVELFPVFQFLSDIVPVRTPCRYQAEMSSESTLVPLPVLMKDEKKYAEVVNVLDQLEVWVCRRFRCQTSYLLIISSIKK